MTLFSFHPDGCIRRVHTGWINSLSETTPVSMSEPPVLADQKDNTLNMHERSSIGLSKGTKRGPPGLPEWTARPGGWEGKGREGKGRGGLLEALP